PLLSFGNGVYGPGHASFFRSPDGTELWCAYHGMDNENSDMSPDYRYCHLQRVEFNKTGYPVMGEPIGDDTLIAPPSGEKE
ncbi:MAG: family 43 glycosylhydrolase, partial [Clostridia bacterium]|nr:family 43 glycosylhydrolase [Clostridia bacterium]